jgi:ribosome biogenesis GTPase A/tellurite resistance protein
MRVETKIDQSIAQANEQIDYVFLLYVYMLCVDGQEHINERKALYKIAERNGVNVKTKEEAEKIFTQSDQRFPLNTVIESIPVLSHKECMQNLAALAYVDGYCDPMERELLESLSKLWGISELELDRFCVDGAASCCELVDNAETLDYSQQFTLGEKLIAGVDRLSDGQLLRVMKSMHSDSIKKIINGLKHKTLLSGPDYDKAIEKCRKIAQEDIAIATPALKTARDSLERLKSELNCTIKKLGVFDAKEQAKTAKEVLSFLKSTEEYFASEIFRKVESINASLHKKKRAMQCFTISFLGKTKAGKSTLHAVVTGEGEDAIGAGKQRTTRLNRVYEWKNIRIIDTPGIGAPGGKTDEEIAQSVIDESDIICFVLNNNNQQETEFNFLKDLKAKAKPLLILLNVKANLTHPRKLERFLQNSEKLFSIEDKSSLGGHFDRIQRYAKQHYGNDYFEIIPVQLYAALLGRNVEDESQKRDLLNASRLKNFLDSLKMSLIRDGVIRRSQTLLGCTVGEIEPISNWTAVKKKELEVTQSKISSYRKRGTQIIDSFGVHARKELKIEFGKVFSGLRDTIQEFAETNWDCKESSLQRNWEAHVEKRKALLESALKKVMNSYSNDVQDFLEEIGSEISLLVKLNFTDPNLTEQNSSTFVKNFMKIGGGLLGIASSGAFLYAAIVAGAANWWNPLGWGLMATGILMGLVSGFFTSKAKKMQKAVNNITKALRECVNEQEKCIVNNVLNEFKSHTDKVEGDIRTYFSVMEKGLQYFMKAMQLCNYELIEIQRWLNLAYAKRVVDWVQNEQTMLTEESIRNSTRSVERVVGKKMIITTKGKITLKKTIEEIQAVLQEELTITGEQDVYI